MDEEEDAAVLVDEGRFRWATSGASTPLPSRTYQATATSQKVVDDGGSTRSKFEPKVGVNQYSVSEAMLRSIGLDGDGPGVVVSLAVGEVGFISILLEMAAAATNLGCSLLELDDHRYLYYTTNTRHRIYLLHPDLPFEHQPTHRSVRTNIPSDPGHRACSITLRRPDTISPPAAAASPVVLPKRN